MDKKPEVFRLISETDAFYTASWDDILLAANIVYEKKKFIVAMEQTSPEILKILFQLPSPYDSNIQVVMGAIPMPILHLLGKSHIGTLPQEHASFMQFEFRKYQFGFGTRRYTGWFVNEPKIVWEKLDV